MPNIHSNPQGYSDVVEILEVGAPKRIDYGGNAVEVLGYSGDPLNLRVFTGNQRSGHAEVFELARTERLVLNGVRVGSFDYLDVVDTAGGGKLKLRIHHHRAVVASQTDPPSISRRRTLAVTPQEITWTAGGSGVWDLALAPDSIVERDGLVQLLERSYPAVGDSAPDLPFWDGYIMADRDFDVLVFVSPAWDGTGAAGPTDFKPVQRWQSNGIVYDGTHGDPNTAYPELDVETAGATPQVVNLQDSPNFVNNNTGSGVHNDNVGNPAKIPVGNVRMVITWDNAVTTHFRFWIGARG